MVEVKTEKTQVTLPILITEKNNTQPQLGLDWLDKLEIGLQGSQKQTSSEIYPQTEKVRESLKISKNFSKQITR